MPGYDGTGPRGMGPMTGGARGYCVVSEDELADRQYDDRRGAGYRYNDTIAPEKDRELDALKSEMKSLKDTLSRIESQIEKLSKK